MAFTGNELLANLVEAAKQSLAADWDKVKGPVQAELTGLAYQAAYITDGLISGLLDQDNKDIYEQLLRNRVQSIGVLIIGLVSVTIQNVLNALLDALKAAMKGVLDFIF